MPSIRRGEHEPLAPGTGPAAQVLVEFVDHRSGQGDGPEARARLQRLQRPSPGLVPPELLDDLDVAVEQIDPVAS